MLALETEILPTIASERQVEYRLSGLSEQEGEFLNDARTGLILSLLAIYLVLSWVFASWTRPLVVMSVIPFGLVGTIYGHAVWNVPLSMFTVVGLLGMTGIIINDSIVLVTTIDEKAKDRGLIPSIIDGAADRLRPVFLTTATTVLGLVPLLYEQSSQAQFLKPTVITLVYGLGFGMFLVLLIVPSLIAIQSDLGRLTQTTRRGLHFRRSGMRAALGLGAALIVAWLGATMGAFAVTGALPQAITEVLSGTPVAEDVTLGTSLGLFVAGSGVICLALYLVSAIALVVSRMRRPA
jgi:predicted RND superfamily exporter protein